MAFDEIVEYEEIWSLLTREDTIFCNQTLGSVTLHASCISHYKSMDKILGGVSSENVWVKSLGEHDNVDKFVHY